MTAVLHGDCLAILPTLPPDSFDSCVTDPPYHLVSIVKRFGGEDRKKWETAGRGGGTASPYQRVSTGFMGKQWDGGDVAARPETWAAVWRVLKPGAHLVAFGGTRTYHRMVCAIEDAGFEIRDCIQWIYGSGFPKSHDVSKGIDRAAGVEREVIGEWNMPGRGKRSEEQKYGLTNDSGNITAPATDAARQWQGWGTALKPACEPIVLARKPLSEGTVAANVLRWGTGAININACRVSAGERRADDSNGGNGYERTGDRRKNIQSNAHRETSVVQPDERGRHSSSADECALDGQQSLGLQDGYRPSARSDDGLPHSDLGRGQASVLPQGDEPAPLGPDAIEQRNRDHLSTLGHDTAPDIERLGRWPANVITDGSDEVVQGFPETGPGPGNVHTAKENGGGVFGGGRMGIENIYKDEGTAARFFYTAKADSDERIGSKHPTVKPIDLMQWLVRLVTPKGGLVLDPFAGTGTTGEAAWREGCRATLIEREAEYLADIARRMELMKAGPDERAREIIKASGKAQGHEDLPLFDRAWADMWAKPFDKPELVWGKK